MEMPTSICESDLLMLGLQPGEEVITPVRIAATLIVVTVTSAWLSGGKIKRLCLFFAHWISGIVLSLILVVEHAMVTLCWADRNVESFIKTMYFVKLTASNMLAITNLAVCINLTLIVMSHRTLSRVKSLSSPGRVLVLLAISMGIAAASIPFCDTVLVVGTGFWLVSFDEERDDVIQVLTFLVQFVVGVCMFCIVAWLLRFRMKEIKECWNTHRRIRYYFGLTVVGTAVSLGIGICGTINVNLEEPNKLLFVWSWVFRFIHIALDTFVLYGVLRDRSTNIDERGDDEKSGAGGLSSGRPVSGKFTQRASGSSKGKADLASDP
eukprot:g5061.t1